jgi:hypothetical protein
MQLIEVGDMVLLELCPVMRAFLGMVTPTASSTALIDDR